MIQQKHLEDHPTYEVNDGKQLTMPGMAVNYKQALQMYNSDTLTEKAKAFYEEEGFSVPDFNKMSKIDRLLALNEYRGLAISKRDKLDTIYEDAKKAQFQNQNKIEADGKA